MSVSGPIWKELNNRLKFLRVAELKWSLCHAAVLALLPIFIAASGCRPESSTPETATVVVYTSIDEYFARGLLIQFEKETGIHVQILTDTEAGKTTGFLRRLRRESERPRCDVWWSSEVFGTIELARRGILEPYESPSAADIPLAWKDPRQRWTALAARARVLAFNTERLTREQMPKTWRELANPAWAGRLALANPQFGTTRGHIGAMFASWGRDETTNFLQALHDYGTQIADGNAHAVRLVVSGSADLCATDTDDVWAAQRRGEPIDLVYPRLTPDEPVVWIPCSVARVRGGPNERAAHKLIDFLVSSRVEQALAESDSGNVPVRPKLRKKLSITGPQPTPPPFDRITDLLDSATSLARDILLR